MAQKFRPIVISYGLNGSIELIFHNSSKAFKYDTYLGLISHQIGPSGLGEVIHKGQEVGGTSERLGMIRTPYIYVKKLKRVFGLYITSWKG